jgi:hypothetical protein
MPIKKVNRQQEAINLGDLGTFVAGGGLPEGDYALEFQVVNFQATKKDGTMSGPARLGVMVTAHSLTDSAADARTQFYSMGSKAHESFAPNPDTGKGIVPIAGGAGMSGLPMNTNYYYLLKSLYDCGLPQGVFTSDFSVLDGVHVHMTNVPEPEERKAFAQSVTAEVSEIIKKSGTIAVVTEIKDGGAPWEGGGGIPKKAEVKPNGKAQHIVTAPPIIAPKSTQKAPSTGLSEEDLMEVAINGVTIVLEKSPDGCPKLVLQTSTYKAVRDAVDDNTASLVIDTFFKDPETTNSLLGQLGYKLSGVKVVPA